MAISLVGTPQTGSIGNGDGFTLTFDVAPSENDVVVVALTLPAAGAFEVFDAANAYGV